MPIPSASLALLGATVDFGAGNEALHSHCWCAATPRLPGAAGNDTFVVTGAIYRLLPRLMVVQVTTPSPSVVNSQVALSGGARQ